MTSFYIIATLAFNELRLSLAQQTFACSKSTIETLEQGVKYVQKKLTKTPEKRQ